MDQFEGLQTIAEVAVGIAGFGGIVVAITRGRQEWQSWDEIRIWGVLVPSISAVPLALLPLGLSSAGLASDALWRVSSLAMIAVGLTSFLAFGLRFRSTLAQGPFHPVLGRFLAGGSVLNLLCQASNAVGIGFRGSFSVYYFGLLWLLIYSGLEFISLIFLREKQR
jgi:hypothetical protein